MVYLLGACILEPQEISYFSKRLTVYSQDAEDLWDRQF